MSDTTTVVLAVVGAVTVVLATGMIATAIMYDGSTPSELQLREKKASAQLERFNRKLSAYDKSRDKALEEWEKTNPVPELA